jgi:hypothetical protein
MDHAKRKFLQATLFGAGGVGLRALATGLPIGLFSRSRRAKADINAADSGLVCANPQYLINFISSSGDPMNANVPGCYDDDGIYHAADPSMAKTAMTVGKTNTFGAAVWAGLTPAILNRTAFFHNTSETNAHPDLPKVQRVQGDLQRSEMLCSFIAKNTGGCLGPGGDAGVGGTVQPQPITMANEIVTFEGAVQAPINPQNLQAVLTGPGSPLLQNLQALRDSDLDKLNALFKQSGTTSQIALLDQYALSQSEARNINQQILSDLSKIGTTGNPRFDYNIAATVLLKMNLCPVVCLPLQFGGDNHGDMNLQGEVTQHQQSIGQLEDLYGRLSAYGLQDQTTIMYQAVFGRTLSVASHEGDKNGRNHNGGHHCTVVVSSALNAGVYGGVALNSSSTDYQALPINSSTGQGATDGDISYEDLLPSVAKTISAACGVAEAQYDFQLTAGQALKVALKST